MHTLPAITAEGVQEQLDTDDRYLHDVMKLSDTGFRPNFDNERQRLVYEQDNIFFPILMACCSTRASACTSSTRSWSTP